MKICIFISTLLAGGAERNACMLANYLAKNNDVKLLTFQKQWAQGVNCPHVIMGHSHYLGAFALEKNTLILLGDWPNRRSYFLLEKQGGTLHSLDEPVEIGFFG